MQRYLDGENFVNIKRKIIDEIKSKEDSLELLDVLENNYRDILTGKDIERNRAFRKDELIRAIELIEETRKNLFMNMNYSYALKNLVIKLEG